MMNRSIFLLLALVLGITYLSPCANSKKVSELIISTIDQTYDEDGNRIIDLNEAVEFDWDKAVLFEEGRSSKAISKALGVDFDNSYGASCGIIFVYKDEIVYKETFFMKIDAHNRFRIIVNTADGLIVTV